MNELRPQKFDEIVGQEEIKEILKISIVSAKQREDILGHCCLIGNAGYGKTTFAQCISNEIGAKIHLANGASFKNIKDIAPYILKLKYGDVLFIDEIHRVRKICQEFLYTVMEDFYCVLGKKKDIVQINVPKFTLIGATTEFGSLTQPFRQRFKLPLFFSCYKKDELAKLALLNSSKLNIELDNDAITELTNRCRNTPRILNRLLEWCRDFTIHRNPNTNKITITEVIEAMKLAKIDDQGFTFWDRRYIICLKQAGVPLALNTIASILKIDEKSIKDEIEPFLLDKNLIIKTTKGRMLKVNNESIEKKQEICSETT